MASTHPNSQECDTLSPAGPGGPDHAVVIVGHGSLRPGAGSDLVRLAAHITAAGVGLTARPAFLSLSRPTLLEALAHHSARGSREVTVVPYFLTFGRSLRADLTVLLNQARSVYPQLRLRTAAPLGDHPMLARLLLQRALEVDYLHAHPLINYQQHRRPLDEGAGWQPQWRLRPTALLIAAHGSPEWRANRPIYAVARHLRASAGFAAVLVAYMHTNRPSLTEVLGSLARRNIQSCIAVPYFLSLGSHVAVELPALLASARAHSPAELLLAEHLSFDRALVAAVLDRISETVALCEGAVR